jgi:hypothetical protein
MAYLLGGELRLSSSAGLYCSRGTRPALSRRAGDYTPEAASGMRRIFGGVSTVCVNASATFVKSSVASVVK